MLFTKNKVLNERDETFTKLLDIIPNALSRKETKEYLNEYTFIPEGRRIHKDFEFESDCYYRPKIVPRPLIRILYDEDRPFSSDIYLVYPLKGVVITGVVHQAHRKMLFKKLDSVLEEKFGRPGRERGLTFWHKGFTLVVKTLYQERDGRLGIRIASSDTRTYPVERIFEDYENKKGLFGPLTGHEDLLEKGSGLTQ